MAKILFVWELGGGHGHLARMRPIVRGLAKRGHQLFAAMNDVTRARRALGDLQVRLVQAPLLKGRPGNYIERPATFAHILHNIGFGDDETLAALTDVWRELYGWISPDVVVFDHSPTALLAARGLPMRRVVIGTGFACPSDGDPLQVLQSGDDDEIRRVVSDVLARINRRLACWNQPALERVLQFYGEVDETFVTTFAEVDHHGPRDDVRYWGAWTEMGGDTPDWPTGDGPRVFGYLKRFKALPALLEHLNRRKLPSLLVIDRLPAEMRTQYSSQTLRLESRPLDMRQVTEQCDLALLNGTHGASVAMLLAGKPALHIPLFLEQAIMTRSIVRHSAGLGASTDDPRMVTGQLDRLLASDDYREGARRFAGRYADYDPDEHIQAIIERVQQLAGVE